MRKELAVLLRYHWSALPLALVAVVLLVLATILNAPASTAAVGAGAALAGAAATRIIDLDRERRAEAVEAKASRRRDLDETRRLAYMVLAARGTERYELVATLVNALAHHGSGVNPNLAMRHITAVVSESPGGTSKSERWLRQQINEITIDLDAM